MPHVSGGRGTYLLDRQFPAIGRIRRASGTTHRATFEAVNLMLSTLWSQGRLDVLRHLRDGTMHPLEAWDTYRRLGIHGFSATPRRPLADLTIWADQLRASARHRQNVQSAVRVLLRLARDEWLEDLPSLLRRYRRSARPRMFNVVKAAVQVLLRHNLGRRDETYLAVADVPVLPYVPAKRQHLSPAQLGALDLAQPYQAMAWAMATTGMGPSEYWGGWSVAEDRVAIHGTKRASRDRIVPRVGTPAEPATTYRVMLEAWKVAAGGTLYDLRHCYAGWLEDAGIPPARARVYMGHKAKTMTEHYQMRDVEPYLVDDAKRLARYIGPARRAVRAG